MQENIKHSTAKPCPNTLNVNVNTDISPDVSTDDIDILDTSPDVSTESMHNNTKNKKQQLLSDEEILCVQALYDREEEINSTIGKRLESLDALEDTAQNWQQFIDEKFESYIAILYQRKDILKKQLVSCTLNKKEKILSNITSLKQSVESVQKCQQKCDEMSANPDTYIVHRKQQILKLTQIELTKNVPIQQPTYPAVALVMNDEDFVQRIGTIGKLNNYNIPFAPKMSFQNVTFTTAEVCCKANGPDAADCDPPTHFTIKYRKNTDSDSEEKKTEEITLSKSEWEFKDITPDDSDSNVYEISDLTHDTCYDICVMGRGRNGTTSYSSIQQFHTRKLMIDSDILEPIAFTYLEAITDKCQSNHLNKQFIWKLLYSGKRHGFEASTFHSKCDLNYSQTITIIETDSGNVFGGYTTQAWTATSSGKHKEDIYAFLFSLKNSMIKSDGNDDGNACVYEPKIFDIKKGSEGYAIWTKDDYLPCFGYNCDVTIYDKCNEKAKSYSKVSSYDLESNQTLCGTKYFEVKNIEVFQLIDFDQMQYEREMVLSLKTLCAMHMNDGLSSSNYKKCALDLEWNREWKDYIGQISLSRPGKIDNKSLINGDGRLIAGPSQYKVVPQSVFDFLQSQYGGGPRIFV